MAQKRMFSKTITSSSRFLMMPHSTQNLYFHLGMNADDDGFCEHFTVMRMTESKPDDLKILQVKDFVHVFDERVLVILDWKENNLIRLDRYTASKYLEIYKYELSQIEHGNLMATNGIPDDNQWLPQVRLGKVRLGKVRLGKVSISCEESEEKAVKFNQFWNDYDKKIDRTKCEKLWNKLNPDVYPIIFAHITEYVKATPDKKFRKNPETYLNNRAWENEIIFPVNNTGESKPTIDESLEYFEKLGRELGYES
jgi:hypothetical protein